MRALPLVVLKSMLKKSNYEHYRSVVRDDLFGDMMFRRVFGFVERLHQETPGDINTEMLLSAIEIAYNENQDQVEETQDVVFDMQEAEDVEQTVLHKYIGDWVAKALASKAAEYIATNVHSPDFSVDVLADLVDRAVEVSGRIDAQVVEYDQAPIHGTSDLGPVRIGLGFSPELDRRLGGGIGVGELSFLFAPPGRGKTSLLCFAGAHAAKQGYRVLHITLEISAAMVTGRYDQALTGCTKEELAVEPGLVRAARQSVTEAGGALYIKDWSHSMINANDIISLVRKMRSRKQDVNYVIIDYLELMSAVNANRENRFNYSNVAKEVRAAGVQLDVPILTAWQINRSGSQSEYLEASDVSECWDIVKHADTIIGLNQNKAERTARRMRLNIIKQRQSTSSGQVTLLVDMDKLIVRPTTLEDDVGELRELAGRIAPPQKPDTSAADSAAEVPVLREDGPASTD